ncbi:MAG: hypothetical protein L3J39_16270 [Verrucomicrobiales bacterium]|nr:hypothetical protein [Verrucomicrobiales bacterium]
MNKQPNFQELFYQYFGSTPKKITYSIRSGANRLHDIIFLKSLIHDARFVRSRIEINEKRLMIPINRDCWELGIVKHEKKRGSELYVTDACLSVSPVADLEWSFNNEEDFNLDTELWISDLIVQKMSCELLKVRFEGDFWSLSFTVPKNDFKMCIQDSEIPYLYSERYCSPN